VSLRKKPLQILLDAALIVLAFALAFLFRFDFQIPSLYHDIFWKGFWVVVITKPIIFLSMGLYRKLWHYASVQDALTIFKVVSAASLCSSFFLTFFTYFNHFPRSIIILDWLILLFLTASSRLAWRLYREQSYTSNKNDGRRTLILGAGEAGRLLLAEIDRQQVPDHKIIGFIDDDDKKKGMFLCNVPVLGKQEQMQDLVRQHRIEELIIAVPSVRGIVLRKIIENCNKTGARIRILPAISDIIINNKVLNQIRDVELEDLLGREPVTLDKSGISYYLRGKTVLVSGAAGSIGSEICRQIAEFEPGKLILLDNAETQLFYIDRELAAKHSSLKIIPVLGDVRHSDKIDTVFAHYTPEVVFHAAAYKHVSLLEHNPTQAVLNNCRGTKVLADAAHRSGVSSFVMVSSDKAVNPTNIMGASKRVAEIYIQSLARKSSTKFSTVRFGNVLGSSGSVIPIFLEQIKKGGPVTVTDPEVIRYFMTIPEAAQLVLQAGCLGQGGEIFLLDMGEPVRILDLAEELIRLSGLIPYKDIDIVFTGLRSGEKLYEELLTKEEGVMETPHKKIKIAASATADSESFLSELAQLFRLAETHDIQGLVIALRCLVMEYTPSQQYQHPVEWQFQSLSASRQTKKMDRPHSAQILPLRQPVLEQQLVADSK
jgi:FlaA1/EpsC-like NDP-sugar epimerase